MYVYSSRQVTLYRFRRGAGNSACAGYEGRVHPIPWNRKYSSR